MTHQATWRARNVPFLLLLLLLPFRVPSEFSSIIIRLSRPEKSHGASSSPFSFSIPSSSSFTFLSFIMLNDIQGKEEGSPSSSIHSAVAISAQPRKKKRDGDLSSSPTCNSRGDPCSNICRALSFVFFFFFFLYEGETPEQGAPIPGRHRRKGQWCKVRCVY